MSLYKILELEPNASLGDIKKSYRKLARKYHPDKTKLDNHDKFLKINYAYEILSDDKTRKEYHRMNNLDQSKFESLLNKIFNNNLKINELKTFGINISDEDFKYLDSNFYNLISRFNITELVNFFINGSIPKNKSNIYNLCSDSEVDLWNNEQSEHYYKLPLIYSSYSKNDIKLELDVSLEDILENKKRKIKLSRKINDEEIKTTFIFNIDKPYIIFSGGGDINDDIGNLIIKLNLPFGLDWEDNKIIINHEMNLYEMIYGMDININLGFKEIRINSWTPVRDGYKIDLEDIKIGNHYLQIKFNLNYNHTDDKKKILQNYFRD